MTISACVAARRAAGSVVLESDQQIRRESGELPEDEQQDDVVAEDEAEHGPHEREQRDVEPGDVGMAPRGTSSRR